MHAANGNTPESTPAADGFRELRRQLPIVDLMAMLNRVHYWCTLEEKI